jgi:LuxR family maltose regulon positive regulatory protein
MVLAAPSAILPLNMTDSVTEVESAVRVLLHAAPNSAGGNTGHEPRVTLDVCVDGQPYTVCIIASPPKTGDLRRRLSPRELDIADLIARGLPTKTIALNLGLRPCTVSTYTKRIYLKLNVNSRAEMVATLLNDQWMRFDPSRPAGSSYS